MMNLQLKQQIIFWRLGFMCLISGALLACSSGDSGGQETPPLLRSWEPGTFFPSANYSDLCANPRTGTDPFTGGNVVDRQGRVVDENNWLRSIHSEIYLWYDEIIDDDPALYTTSNYFDLQITLQPSDTGSSRAKDIFHSSIDTQQFVDNLFSGLNAGYGARFIVLAPSPPREVVVAYVEPGSPADNNGLSRGARILTVDGVDVVNGNDANTLNAGLFPAALSESHDFLVRDLNTTERNITLVSAEITSTPVQFASVIAGTNVGYLLFNQHIATAETQLIDAINILISMGATDDVILDLRYNGGGLLDLASELAFMIGGDATTNLTFERMQFNDRYSNIPVNPFTGDDLSQPFLSTVQGFSENLTQGDDLPTLNAQNVVVITSAETCSASEAVMNGLRGAGVNVIQVGTTTCGKPYGSFPLDNCGTAYLFTQFEGFNELGQGGYSDGFKPANASGDGVSLQGCVVSDDFNNNFADPAEANIAAALGYLAVPGTCPAIPVGLSVSGFQKPSSEISASNVIKDPNKLDMKIVF